MFFAGFWDSDREKIYYLSTKMDSGALSLFLVFWAVYDIIKLGTKPDSPVNPILSR